MNTTNQIPFGPQPFQVVPGRVIARVERYCTPITKRIVELRWVKSTIEENGVYKTEEWTEVDPPFADGTVPESVREIRECWRCLSLITRFRACPDCGREFCEACMKQKPGTAAQEVKVCMGCAEKTASPFWSAVRSFLWD
jgi:hypothetical protein